MLPLLISVGPIQIYSFGVLLLLAWLIFSFVFWRTLRAQAVDEERIFDLTFYATIASLIAGRLGFIVLHPNLFADNFLKVAALWVQPGLSLYSALVGGFLTLIFLGRLYKVRLGYILDAFAFAYPLALIVGKIGSFLDGSEVGKAASVPWGVLYVGHVGARHPIQLYEIGALMLLVLFLFFIAKRAAKHRWPYGMLGIWFLFLYSTIGFSLEFLRESDVYLVSLSPNQIILIAIFCESIGAFYVRGGVREKIRPKIGAVRKSIGRFFGDIYAKFSKRSSE